jgi:hypothetical protein
MFAVFIAFLVSLCGTESFLLSSKIKSVRLHTSCTVLRLSSESNPISTLNVELVDNNNNNNNDKLIQLQKEVEEIKTEIFNLKMVLALIPRGESRVPESKASQQTDTNIILLCDYSKENLLKQLSDQKSMLTTSTQRLLLLEQNAVRTTSGGMLLFCCAILLYFLIHTHT